VNKFKVYAARYRKGLVAAVAGAGELVALGVLHGNALVAAEVILAVGQAVGVVAVPNEPKVDTGVR
jgi:hypothetical protein